MEIHAVEVGGFRVRRPLPDVFDDLFQPPVAEAEAGHFLHIPVGIERGAPRKFQTVDEALRVAHPAEPRGKLDEDRAAVGVAHAGQVAPRGKTGAASVDTGKIGEVVQLDKRFIDAETHGDEPRGDEPHAAPCALFEIFEHLFVGAPRFLAHIDVAHRRHHKPVFEFEFVHLNRLEHRFIGKKFRRHLRRGKAFVPPIAVRIGEFPQFLLVVHKNLLAFRLSLL